jgi:hypothetical protein
VLKGVQLNNASLETGCTALHIVAERGDASSMKRLIETGADFSLQDFRGVTAMELAKYSLREEEYKELQKLARDLKSASAADRLLAPLSDETNTAPQITHTSEGGALEEGPQNKGDVPSGEEGARNRGESASDHTQEGSTPRKKVSHTSAGREHPQTRSVFDEKIETRRDFHLNILLVGESGAGKTTYLRSMMQLYGLEEQDLPAQGVTQAISPPKRVIIPEAHTGGAIMYVTLSLPHVCYCKKT